MKTDVMILYNVIMHLKLPLPTLSAERNSQLLSPFKRMVLHKGRNTRRQGLWGPSYDTSIIDLSLSFSPPFTWNDQCSIKLKGQHFRVYRLFGLQASRSITILSNSLLKWNIVLFRIGPMFFNFNFVFFHQVYLNIIVI